MTLIFEAQTLFCWHVFAFFLLIPLLLPSTRRGNKRYIGHNVSQHVFIRVLLLFVQPYLHLRQQVVPVLCRCQTVFYLPVFSPQLPRGFLSPLSSFLGRVSSESSFRTLFTPDQLQWLHKWLAKFMRPLWFLPFALVEGWGGGGRRVMSLYSLFSVFPLFPLLFDGSCCSVLSRPETCIKLY